MDELPEIMIDSNWLHGYSLVCFFDQAKQNIWQECVEMGRVLWEMWISICLHQLLLHCNCWD